MSMISKHYKFCSFCLFQNEVTDIPFFDIELPYELALKIFQHLTCAELGRCAQVSYQCNTDLGEKKCDASL